MAVTPMHDFSKYKCLGTQRHMTRRPTTQRPTTEDPRPRDPRPSDHDPKTCDPKEAGVQEARGQEAGVQEAGVREAGGQEARVRAVEQSRHNKQIKNVRQTVDGTYFASDYGNDRNRIRDWFASCVPSVPDPPPPHFKVGKGIWFLNWQNYFHRLVRRGVWAKYLPTLKWGVRGGAGA